MAHVEKTDALQESIQATNVNAISAPSGRIGRRPTRIDTSMQSVDALSTASNNSRKLPATMEVVLSKFLLEWFFRFVFGNTERLFASIVVR